MCAVSAEIKQEYGTLISCSFVLHLIFKRVRKIAKSNC
jgi:hypothetical protein